ncbi:hypothetical protein P5V15_008291 [Pogonomyrmex californicus]
MISNRYGEDRVWKNLQINDKNHIICFTKEAESWKVLLTDLIEIWMETLTDETMFHKCQSLNPLLNLDAFDWKQLILDMLNNIPQYVQTNVLEINMYRIELRKDKEFVKLKFSLDLLKGTPQQFWENVTMPFCLSSMELIRQHKILLDLVKQKDEEIAEYKAEGAKLIRKYIATKPFSEELFHIDAVGLIATDFVKTFQSVLHFYNELNLPNMKYTKTESKVSSNSISDDVSNIDENAFPDSSRNEFKQKLRQNESDKNEQVHSKVKKCEENPSSSKILDINSMSHTIYKLKKNKKTLSDFIK